jgi:hypothetical protein
MKIQCPSVGGVTQLTHEPCTQCHAWWGKLAKRCTAPETIPVGNLTKKIHCPLARVCRWAIQSPDGVCVPMTYGTLCEHQGGDFNTFDFEEI